MASQLAIPVENIFYLLCYAWQSLSQSGLVDISQLKGKRVADLLGHVLTTGLNRQLRQGLERHYQVRRHETAVLRGKLELTDTIKRVSLTRQKAFCTYHDLDPDTQANRIILATVRSLISDDELSTNTRSGLKRLQRGLSEVNDERVTRRHFGRVNFHRNNRLYRFLISICRLWLDRSFVDEKSGKTRFRDFDRDERQMRLLFESFVRNFYAHHLIDAKVRAVRTQWSISDGYEQAKEYLPQLQTDICILEENRLLVIDTKFTESIRIHQGKARFKEGHIFQIFAYMSNLAKDPRFSNMEVSGMLLYPATSDIEDQELSLIDFPFRVCHVNLATPWQQIEEKLLELYK